MKTLVFDTETSGMLQFNQPDNHPLQPHLVQLAFCLLNEDYEKKSSFYCLIKPDGWTIAKEAEAVHGISLETCKKFGIPILTALQTFAESLSQADRVVAHNISFDSRVINIESCRVNLSLRHNWAAPHNICTMKSSTDYCKLPGKIPGKYKWPKLHEALENMCGEVLLKAHDAMADVEACVKVFRKLTELGIVK